MTLEELKDYYQDLLIVQYKGLEKAEAHVRALADLALIDLLPLELRTAFSVEQSSGAQLDMVGKYAGVSRTGYTFTRQVTLDDEAFRVLIRLAIIKNTSDSSLKAIQDLLNNYFLGQLYVFDYGMMRISYFLSSGIASTDLAEMFIVQGLLPKPMGVTLSSTIRHPVLDAFFGFRSYPREGYNNSPFNEYSDYQETWPWLSYNYQIGTSSSFMSFLSTEVAGVRLDQEDGDGIYA